MNSIFNSIFPPLPDSYTPYLRMTDTESEMVSLSPNTSSISSPPSSPSSITSLNVSSVSDYITHHPLNSTLYGHQGFHICHLNCMSLLSKLDQIKRLLRNKVVQIMTLSESWLSPSISDEELFIEGYKLIRQDRGFTIKKKKNNKKTKNRRSGGVCMYIRDDIIVNVNSYKHLNSNNQNLESHWVECKLDFMKNIVIGNFYRPPNGNQTFFINHILDISKTIGNIKNKEVYVLGDININLKEKTNISNLLIESMKLCKLIQIINVPTRLGKTKNTLLDHIYTNCNPIQAKGTGPMSI